MALYQAEEQLSPDELEISILRIEIATKIERLRSELQHIAGEDALEQFDCKRLAIRFIATVAALKARFLIMLS